MTVVKVIRYRTRPECAEENQRLIGDVFAELAESRPGGLRYATFRLEDGVSFLHVAALDRDPNPLQASAAFGTFQSDLADRLAEGPIPSDASIVGSYRFLSE